MVSVPRAQEDEHREAGDPGVGVQSSISTIVATFEAWLPAAELARIPAAIGALHLRQPTLALQGQPVRCLHFRREPWQSTIDLAPSDHGRWKEQVDHPVELVSRRYEHDT